jgi:RND family efflux transporter MFP subunit
MEAFAQPWLAMQCQMIVGVSKGVLALGMPDRGPFEPAAYWPEGTDGAPELREAARLALSKREAIVQAQPQDPQADTASNDRIACPLLINDRLFGVVAIEMATRPEPQQRAVLQLLQWSAAWLEVLYHQQLFATKDRLITAVQLVATTLERPHFQASATALATDLATRLTCDRVSLGFVDGRHVRVRALSHSAQFGSRTNLIRAIEDAMDEALDQQDSVVYPAVRRPTPQLVRSHAALAKKHGSGAICSVPISDNERVIGTLTLERPAEQPFDADTVELCEHVASLVGPILELKRREDRWLIGKAWDAFRRRLSDLFGPQHWALKSAVALTLILVVFLSLVNGDFRVTAPATLEGTVQRVVVAPMDGFVATALARAGDVVKAGAVLCTLDDKDLKLERLKWSSQREQYLREYRQALVNNERAQVRILNAQIEQAAAQVALIDEELSRTRLIAPFDGVVVTGDLSQSLGAPVQRGDVLFEVAPLDSYRLILEVDERDVTHVAVGQPGELALSGMPGERLAMTVEKITPVAAAKEGRNYFRVEGHLETASDRLRPGMEGVGKITIGERRLIWIWTHKLVDWLRLWAWSWWA